MFAISFDLVISDLKMHYGEPYNRAYFEIKTLLQKHGFEWISKKFIPCALYFNPYQK